MAPHATNFRFPTPREIYEDFKLWVRERGLWWATSIFAHVLLICAAALFINTTVLPPSEVNEPRFEAKIEPIAPDAPIEHFDLGDPPLETTELNTDTLMLEAPSVTEQVNTSSTDTFEQEGGGLGSSTDSFYSADSFGVQGLGSGPALKGLGGLSEAGHGTKIGSGGKGEGFGSRGAGVRRAMLGSGGTKQSERAVSAALNWLARHQLPDGRWSLSEYKKMCHDSTCTGTAQSNSDCAATAMGLLPFLAAGQTHKKSGPYRKNIYGGLNWLVLNQKKTDGDLSSGGGHQMYSHGLATICLCEAYGLTRDPTLHGPAQHAIAFICQAQDPNGGGWRYSPGEAGDTSVVGWQLMALKSGLMAGLEVPPEVVGRAHVFLKSASAGKGGMYGYQPGGGPTPVMSAVGLLCSQYLGTQKQDPAMIEGVAFLMRNQPDVAAHNLYYWYYATQVMHNLADQDWDTWNRKMRRLLIETQVREGCAEGSWDPLQPTKDVWGEHGGRLMMTSLSALTLEVYYRYLPLYKLDMPEEKPEAASKGKK